MNYTEKSFHVHRKSDLSCFLDLLKSTHYLILTGDAGIGKTSFLLNDFLITNNYTFIYTSLNVNFVSELIQNLKKLFSDKNRDFDEEKFETLFLNESIVNKSNYFLENFEFQRENLVFIIDALENYFTFFKEKLFTRHNLIFENFIKLFNKLQQGEINNIKFIFSVRKDFLKEARLLLHLLFNKPGLEYELHNLSSNQISESIDQFLAGLPVSKNLPKEILQDASINDWTLETLNYGLTRLISEWELHHTELKLLDEIYNSIKPLNRLINNDAEKCFQSLNGQEKIIAEKLFRNLINIDIKGRITTNPILISDFILKYDFQEIKIFTVSDVFFSGGREFLKIIQAKASNDFWIELNNLNLIYIWDRYKNWFEEELESQKNFHSILLPIINNKLALIQLDTVELKKLGDWFNSQSALKEKYFNIYPQLSQLQIEINKFTSKSSVPLAFILKNVLLGLSLLVGLILLVNQILKTDFMPPSYQKKSFSITSKSPFTSNQKVTKIDTLQNNNKISKVPESNHIIKSTIPNSPFISPKCTLPNKQLSESLKTTLNHDYKKTDYDFAQLALQQYNYLLAIHLFSNLYQSSKNKLTKINSMLKVCNLIKNSYILNLFNLPSTTQGVNIAHKTPYIIYWDSQSTLTLKNYLTNKEVNKIKFFTEIINAEFSPDDKKLVIIGKNDILTVLDLDSERFSFKIFKELKELTGYKFSRTSSLFLTWNISGKIQGWDINKGAMRFGPFYCQDLLKDIIINEQKKFLICLTNSGVVNFWIWNKSDKPVLKLSFKQNDEKIRGIRYIPSQNILVAWSNWIIKFYKLPRGDEILSSISSDYGLIKNIKILPDIDKIAIIDKYRYVRIFDLKTLSEENILLHRSKVEGIIFIRQNYLISWDENFNIYLWNLKNNKLECSPYYEANGISKIIPLFNNQKLLVVSRDGGAKILKSSNLTPCSFKLLPLNITDVKFLQSEGIFVQYSIPMKKVKIWKISEQDSLDQTDFDLDLPGEILKLLAEVSTGTEFKSINNLRLLSPEEWQFKGKRLNKFLNEFLRNKSFSENNFWHRFFHNRVKFGYSQNKW